MFGNASSRQRDEPAGRMRRHAANAPKLPDVVPLGTLGALSLSKRRPGGILLFPCRATGVAHDPIARPHGVHSVPAARWRGSLLPTISTSGWRVVDLAYYVSAGCRLYVSPSSDMGSSAAPSDYLRQVAFSGHLPICTNESRSTQESVMVRLASAAHASRCTRSLLHVRARR